MAKNSQEDQYDLIFRRDNPVSANPCWDLRVGAFSKWSRAVAQICTLSFPHPEKLICQYGRGLFELLIAARFAISPGTGAVRYRERQFWLSGTSTVAESEVSLSEPSVAV